MAVLTIARELGAVAGGEELALCAALGLRCVSRATLEKRFNELGIDSSSFSRFDESKPGIAGAVTNGASCYWESLRTVILQELIQDNIAIVGRGGNFMLHDLVSCLRIRLSAPDEFRIRQIALERAIPESEAKKIVAQSDSIREKFCGFYYGKSWKDPDNYDLVINTAEIPMEKVTLLIPQLLPGPISGVRKKQLELLARAQVIRQRLCAMPEFQLRFPEVIVDESDTVTLRGDISSAAAARRAVEIVKALPGVSAVNNELNVVIKDIPGRLPFMH
ncbi:MAG: cytidylate kinase-like family protein [Lentisphaerae bacterium]|nr:cytidylate kinase-like family protein [Lentisphaerota bacterium]